MADQVAGRWLGDINPALYGIPYGGGLVDVTSGNNDIGPFQNSDGNTYHVPGFNALPGYDLASGLGTLDPARFVPSLAASASTVGNGDCSSSLSFAAFSGNVHVGRGASCTLTDSAVGGNITVDTGGSLSLNGVTVGGNVQSHGATSIGGSSIVEGNADIGNVGAGSPNVVCDSKIGGNLGVHNNQNETVVGTSASPACSAGNTIGGNLTVNNNTVGSGPSAVVAGNVVGHNLSCQSNSPAPTGGGNTVGGSKSGQCAGF